MTAALFALVVIVMSLQTPQLSVCNPDVDPACAPKNEQATPDLISGYEIDDLIVLGVLDVVVPIAVLLAVAWWYRRRRKLDWWAFAATCFVVVSGLSVLYFPKPAFGNFGDYLALLLWGGAVSEGVKLVRSLPTGVLKV